MKLAVYIGVYACIRDDWMLAAIEEEITLFRFRLRIRQHLVAITLTFYSFFFSCLFTLLWFVIQLLDRTAKFRWKTLQSETHLTLLIII